PALRRHEEAPRPLPADCDARARAEDRERAAGVDRRFVERLGRDPEQRKDHQGAAPCAPRDVPQPAGQPAGPDPHRRAPGEDHLHSPLHGPARLRSRAPDEVLSPLPADRRPHRARLRLQHVPPRRGQGARHAGAVLRQRRLQALIPAAGQEAYRLHPAVAQYARHVNPAFIELLNVLGYGRLYSRALDVWVWDHAGTKYLDCLAGFGSINLGHNHPRLAARLSAFLQAEAPNHFHIGPSPYMAALAAQLATDELEVTLFCNSGAEAVEAALKLARAATGRRKFVYCSGGYHGTTLGALGVMGDERKRAAFVPDSEHIEVPFGDLSALKHVLGRDVAAFIAEPIQGEGGVRVPPAGYLEEAKALCRRHGVLFILDEVQTGIGRTGTLYAEIIPDVRVLAKALGGGIASIGAALTTRELHRKAYGSMARFDWHSSTFGGNSFACVAAKETLRIVDDEKLAANAAARGAQLISGLRERLADHPYIRDIRGCGLL